MTSSSRPSSSLAEPADGRILAIDYGRRWIGLALSDELGLLAQPLATLERTNRRNDLRRLREFVRQHSVRRVVVGYPLRLDGTAGEMAAETARFAARIEKQLGLPVELVDERLSSWEAEQMWRRKNPMGRRAARARLRRQPRKVDQFAAALILRDYLERGQADPSASLGPARNATRQQPCVPHTRKQAKG